MDDRDAIPPLVALTRRGFLQGSLAAAAMMAARRSHAAGTDGADTAAPASGSDAARPVSLLVNGQRHVIDIEPQVTLLDALRDRIGLTGTKKGCDRGQCGACTVLVNGRRINACLTLAVMHEKEPVPPPS